MEPFARNVVHFVRLLRGADLGMSPAHAVDALDALRYIDLNRRDDVRATLACLLVHASDERDIFDAAFDLFWRDPDWEGKLRALLPKVTSGMPPPRRNNRFADALATRTASSKAPVSESKPQEAHARITFSSQERLSHCDFDTLTADEWRTLRHQIRSYRYDRDRADTQAEGCFARHARRSEGECAPRRALGRRLDRVEISRGGATQTAAGVAARHLRIDDGVFARRPVFLPCPAAVARTPAGVSLRHPAHQCDARAARA